MRICEPCFDRAYDIPQSSKHHWRAREALRNGAIGDLREILAAREEERTEWLGDLSDSIAEKLPVAARSSAALKWNATQRKPFLLLHGTTDRGKTRILAILLLAYFRKTGKTPTTFWAGEVGTKVAAAWRDGRADMLMDSTKNAAFLAFDDLDKNTFTTRVAEFIFAVTDHRMRHGLPMIITTNLLGDDFQEVLPTEYGPPLLRRWREYGIAIAP